jgi:hypothetical protein
MYVPIYDVYWSSHSDQSFNNLTFTIYRQLQKIKKIFSKTTFKSFIKFKIDFIQLTFFSERVHDYLKNLSNYFR